MSDALARCLTRDVPRARAPRARDTNLPHQMAKAGRVDDARRLLDAMRYDGGATAWPTIAPGARAAWPTVVTYNSMMDAHGRAGATTRLAALHTHMPVTSD